MSCIGGSSSNASNKNKGKEIVVDEAPEEKKQQLNKGKEIVAAAEDSDGYESEWESDSFPQWESDSDSDSDSDEQQQEQQEDKQKVKPAWLETLLRTKFWAPCKDHGDKNRADQCMFCLKCSDLTCPRCTHAHRRLKIRRYVYRSVVQASDMQELGLEVSRIQTYVINARKVLHLRPMNRSANFRPQAGTPRCITCRTWLRSSPNLYCSLVCEGNFDISQDDFSGPEAEKRYRSLQAHMAAEPSEDAAEELPIDDPEEAEHGIPAQVEPPPSPPPPPAANQNMSFRRRPRKQRVPTRAPFF